MEVGKTNTPENNAYYYPAILLLFVFLSVSQTLWPQKNTGYQFRRLGIDNGLSQNMITAISQDQQGIMWFGTKDGLNRYDGYSFKIYKTDANNTGAISDNHITWIYEDYRKNLWINTRLGGVNLYDETQDAFIRTYESGYISSIFSLQGNEKYGLWITTAEGNIIGLDYKTEGKFPVPHTILNKNMWGGATPANAAPDHKGLLWIVTDKGLVQYDIKSSRVTRHMADFPTHLSSGKTTTRLSPFHTKLISIQVDELHNVWLTSHEGIYLYTPESDRFILYEFQDWIISSSIVQTQKKQTEIWMGSYNGLIIFNTNTLQTTTMPFTELTGNKKHDGLVSTIFKSRDGSVWIGSNGRGIFCYSPNYKIFENSPPFNTETENVSSSSLYNIYPYTDNEGGKKLLFSTLTFFALWNQSHPNPLHLDTAFYSRTATQDKHNNIWLGTSHGLFLFNPNTRKKTVVDASEKIITGLYADAYNQIWYSTPEALRLYIPETGHMETFPYRIPGKESDRSRESIYSTICPDPDGSLWIGTVNGLFRFDISQKTYIAHFLNDPSNGQSISSNEINAILPDPFEPRRYLWIGSPSGLDKLDKENGTFTHFGTKDGLPNNTVYGILSDKAGKLWLSTNQGLSVLDISTGGFTNFDINNGLQSNEFNIGAYSQSADGEMFYGGINGFNRFYPENIQIPKNDVPVIISSVEFPGRENEFTPPILPNQTNRLPHNLNNISITLSSLEYSSTEKVRYAYRIYNQDTAWFALGNNRNVTLTGLSPGKYVFQARGTDSFGRWKEKPVELIFVISPPWYNSFLARTAYLLLFSAVLYYLWLRNKRRTAQKIELENERRQAAAVLELDRVKSRFLANITHEFRTPLTLISGHIERLKSGGGDEKTWQQFDSMERNSQHLLRLINQLMDLSKMESGEYRLRYKKAHILNDLKPGVFAFHSYAEQKNIQFDLEIAPETETWLSKNEIIYAPEALETILKNLLSNACKFTEEKGLIHTTLDYFPEQRQIQITVTNSGTQIPAEDLPRIFDRFYQSDTTYAYEGSGIGLALVKELATLHGGNVSVTSNMETGTTFTVLLKEGPPDSVPKNHFATEQHIDQYQPDNSPDNDTSEELPLILIVEDHAELRRFIRESLGKDYRFTEATNGIEGLEKAKKNVPDLIISDVMMPQMDGFELCRQLKTTETTSHIPIVLLTARATSQDKLDGLETGADDYLTKPFSAAELQLRVRNIIKNRLLLREKYSGKTPTLWKVPDSQPMEKVFIEKVMQTITEHLVEPGFGVENLALMLNMSSSQLSRKLKAITGQTTVSVINGQRMQHALELLRTDADNISGVAFRVGFEDPGYFTKVFRKHFGFLPSDKEKLME